MHDFFRITVPKSTTRAVPHEEILPLDYGVITYFYLYIPPGHAGLTGLQLLYHDHQMYPKRPGDYYTGSRTTIAFGEYQPIVVNPYELKARAWNLDGTDEHSFYFGPAMQRPEEIGREIPATSLQALQDLLGEPIEV